MERIPLRHLVRPWTLPSHSLSQKHPLANHRQIESIRSIRHFSKGPKTGDEPKGFVGRFLENLKSEWSQNTEIKESLEKFRQETQKLEETEALKQAREKYRKVESESIKDVNEVLQTAKESFKSGVDKAKEAKFVKETIKIGDRISSKAKIAAEELSKQGDYLKESTAFKKVSEASETVSKELDDVDILARPYRPPKELLMRSGRSKLKGSSQVRVVEPNEDVQSIDLHKDSKWAQSWKSFKDDNPYLNKVFEFKMKYDESDNPLIRATRSLVDKVNSTVGNMFQTSDLSVVLTEICRVDPNFEVSVFTKDCEKFIIPTILEAMCQNRQDILADWCHEAVLNVLSQPQKEAKKLGYKVRSKIIDIQNVDLALGKIMEHGPVLVFTCQVQQLTYVEDTKGNVVEGDKDTPFINHYVMAFCRDQDDFDPNTAWRLIDIAQQQSNKLLF